MNRSLYRLLVLVKEMSWKEEYRKKLVSVEEAVGVVKSGDKVSFGGGTEPRTLAKALAARKDELTGVKLNMGLPTRDFGWLQPGWEGSFILQLAMPGPVAYEAIRDKRCDLEVGFIIPSIGGEDIDVLLCQVTPPDEHGYCSFGPARFNQKEMVRDAKMVVAEVNSRLIRTYGDNFIHVSEIDYFVEHISSGGLPGQRGLRGGTAEEDISLVKPFAGYISSLIRDGDTIQIGVGTITEPLPRAGLFEGKRDLGWHSEATPKGVAKFVQEGIITGKYKTLNPGKVVATSVGGGDIEDLKFINNNPIVELYSIDYVDNPLVIAKHDNMVAINQALSVDLGGQIASESIGFHTWSAAGGQPAFAAGACLSKGGRNITVLRSTAKKGTISCIVPAFEPGTIVTVPRTMADIIVTEYGVARLKGKTQRQRAEELISIAHPHFRGWLEDEARKLY